MRGGLGVAPVAFVCVEVGTKFVYDSSALEETWLSAFRVGADDVDDEPILILAADGLDMPFLKLLADRAFVRFGVLGHVFRSITHA